MTTTTDIPIQYQYKNMLTIVPLRISLSFLNVAQKSVHNLKNIKIVISDLDLVLRTSFGKYDENFEMMGVPLKTLVN